MRHVRLRGRRRRIRIGLIGGCCGCLILSLVFLVVKDALAFAGTVTQSDAPGLSYAAVYPLVMLLRVVVAQILVLAFA